MTLRNSNAMSGIMLGVLAVLVVPPPVALSADDLNAMSHDDKNWVMAPKDYANTRYSGLDQIKVENVGKLQLVWSFSIGADRGQEAAPLIVNNTMFVVGPYFGVHPNRVFALDATTGALKWSYAPKPNWAAAGVACCDVVTRGLAYDNGKVFLTTLDDYRRDRCRNGQELWHAKLGEINQGETITMAPIVARGKSSSATAVVSSGFAAG